jgi:hypothetical protein
MRRRHTLRRVNGYAATARIGRAQVRACASPAPSSLTRPWPEGAEAAVFVPGSPSPDVRLVDRLADLRVLWRQTTFFLFDADAWL